LKGWKNQPSRKEVERLFEHYRNEVMNREVVDNYFAQEDWTGLVHVARYAEIGLWTAIEAAFCIRYNKGKDGVSNG